MKTAAARRPDAGRPRRGGAPVELVAELERRIEAIESADDDTFGRFTGLDWLLCVSGSLLLPYALVLWFSP